MNKLIYAFLLILLSLPAVSQEISNSDTTTFKERESFKTDELVLKVRNFYEQKNQRALFFIPFAGWNIYDKIFAGIGVFTNPVKETTIGFRFFPSWSFGADRMNYSGRISWKIDLFETGTYIEPFIRTQSSGYDLKMRTILNYNSFQAGVGGRLFQKVWDEQDMNFYLSWHHVSLEKMQWNLADSVYYPAKQKINIFELTTKTNSFRIADVNRQEIKFQFNSQMFKTSFSTLHRINYGSDDNFFEMRLFAGAFLYNNLPSKVDYRFRLSGIKGPDDYTFELPYLSRSETGYNFFTNQIYPDDGFFKTVVPLGQSWDWLVALNLRADFPWKIPLQLFFDIGTYKNAGTLYPINRFVPWNCGIALIIWKDYIEIFIPLLMSEDIMHIYEINQTTFFDRISWTIRFDELNPFKILKK